MRKRQQKCSTYSPSAPSGPPTLLTRVAATPNSITVQWEEVDCLHRNGAITGYVVRAVRDGREEGTVRACGDDRQATVTGLTPSSQYIIQVAAVNSAGTGPYSPINFYGTEGKLNT